MPPKTRSQFWDGDLFVLADASTPQADPFTPIARRVAAQIMRLETFEHRNVIDAAEQIAFALQSAGLDFRDLADQVEGVGAVPRRRKTA